MGDILIEQNSKMAGPCCCSSNIQAAKVLGIIFIVCSLLNCLGTDANGSRTSNIVGGLVGALISGLLVYGASKRNSTAILVWMILAIIECIVFAILAILAIVGLGYVRSEAIGYAIIGIIIFIGLIFFHIWTIVVAKNARREIKEGE